MTVEHTPIFSDASDELQIWRLRVLNILLVVALVAATPRIVKSIVEVIQSPGWWPQTWPFVVAYLFLFALTVLHRLDFRLRVWGLAVISYGYAVMAMVLFGLAGSGLILLLAMPLIGMLLIGNRAGVVLTGLSVLIYGLFTLFAYLGWLQDWLVVRENPTAVASWLGGGAVFVGVLLMLVVMQWFFSHAQTQTLQHARQTANQLVQAHEQLQAHSEALDRYTRLLEVGSLVSREIAAMLDRKELLDRAVHLIAQQLHFDQVAVYLADEGGRVKLAAAARPRPGRQVTDTVRLVIQTGDSQSSQSPVGDRIHHELTLPLQVAGRIVGALDVHATRVVAFSEQEIVALQGMADLLALAMENARLFAETQANLRELDALYRHYTAEAWQQFLRERAETLQYKSGDGDVPEDVWESLFAQVRQAGRTITSESEGQGGERYYLLALPVKLRRVPVGVLGFHRSAAAGPWRPDDIAAIETVADRLALAVDNVRLLEDAQRRAARERAIGAVTSRMRESLEVETVLRTAAEEMRRALNLDRLVVRLAMSDADQDHGDGKAV